MDDLFDYVVAGLMLLVAITLLVVSFFIVGFQFHNERVSGIVYNTKNDDFPGGNTTFSVRAGVDTYVSKDNESSYCLPPNSPYIAVVNKAAEDKNVKVVVESTKYFAFQPPWVCYPNVKVTEVK